MGDEFYSFAREVSEKLGAIQATQENEKEHLSSISKKIDDRCDGIEGKLERHINDPEAHGEKAVNLRAKNLMGYVGFGITAGGAVYAIMKMLP